MSRIAMALSVTALLTGCSPGALESGTDELSPYIICAGGDTEDCVDPDHRAVGLVCTAEARTAEDCHCTGTLIGRQTVLTAAHCVAEGAYPPRPRTDLRFRLAHEPESEVAAASVTINAGYDMNLGFALECEERSGHDLALIQLAQPIDQVAPIKISARPVQSGEPLTIVGFGYSDAPTKSGFGVRRAADSRVVGFCPDFLYELAPHSHELGNICSGDSGGPSLRQTADGPVLVGVHVTGAAGCLSGGNDVRVERHLRWIQTHATDDIEIEPLPLSAESEKIPGERQDFGSSLVLKDDFAAVGAPWHSYGGHVYIYAREGGRWIRKQALGPDLFSIEWKRFGEALALDGDTLVVGAPGEHDADDNLGRVYVFRNVDGTWTQVQKLAPATRIGGRLDLFGSAVALQGDTLIVGAPNASHRHARGAAYVFARQGSSWVERQVLTIPAEGEPVCDGCYDRMPSRVGSEFGASLALDGELLVVGAPRSDATHRSVSHKELDGDFTQTGAVWTYRRDSGSWQLLGQYNLTSVPDLTAGSVATDRMYFGSAVALEGKTLLVGAPKSMSAKYPAGLAIIYQLVQKYGRPVWERRSVLSPPDPGRIDSFSVGLDRNDQFGVALALDADFVVVGSVLHHHGGPERTGAAYVYLRDGDALTLHQELLATDRTDWDYFGSAVAFSGRTVLVGAMAQNLPKDDQGAVYSFDVLPVDRCGGRRVDILTNPAHCGACGVVCNPEQHCERGVCVRSCPADRCDDTCVDLQTDSANCGACGVPCGEFQHCEGGECVCTPREETCDGTDENCNGDIDEGITCPSGQSCIDGGCVACIPVEESCNGLDDDCDGDVDDQAPCPTYRICVEGECRGGRIRIEQPTFGDRLRMGKPATITWSWSVFPQGTVASIDLVDDKGFHVLDIADQVPLSDGSYSWTVPESLSYGSYAIKMSARSSSPDLALNAIGGRFTIVY